MTCAAIWNSFMKMSGGAEIEGEKCDERDFNSSRSESGQAVRFASPWGMPVADYLRLSRTTVWRWCQSGELKAFKVGRGWRIRKSDVDKMVT